MMNTIIGYFEAVGIQMQVAYVRDQGTIGPATDENIRSLVDDHDASVSLVLHLNNSLDLNYDEFSKQVNDRQEQDMWQYALAKAEMLRISVG